MYKYSPNGPPLTKSPNGMYQLRSPKQVCAATGRVKNFAISPYNEEANSEDPAQTEWMRRLICIFAVRIRSLFSNASTNELQTAFNTISRSRLPPLGKFSQRQIDAYFLCFFLVFFWQKTEFDHSCEDNSHEITVRFYFLR